MSEYEVYWIFTNNLLGVPRNNYGDLSKKSKQTSIRMPTRISAGVCDHRCFLTFYTYDPCQL